MGHWRFSIIVAFLSLNGLGILEMAEASTATRNSAPPAARTTSPSTIDGMVFSSLPVDTSREDSRCEETRPLARNVKRPFGRKGANKQVAMASTVTETLEEMRNMRRELNTLRREMYDMRKKITGE